MGLPFLFTTIAQKISIQTVELMDEVFLKLEATHAVTRISLDNGLDDHDLTRRGEESSFPTLDLRPYSISDVYKQPLFCSAPQS